MSFLGFPDNPYYELGRSATSSDHVPSIMTFGVHGGRDAGIAVFNSVKLFKRLLNMGDAKSLIAHPASTTHRQLKPHELDAVGITPDMVRLSVGLEHTDDLIEDLDQALAVPPRRLPDSRPRSRPGSSAGRSCPVNAARGLVRNGPGSIRRRSLPRLVVGLVVAAARASARRHRYMGDPVRFTAIASDGGRLG